MLVPTAFIAALVAEGHISTTVARQAEFCLRQVLEKLPSLPVPRIAPGPDGMVGMTWESGSHHLNVEVFPAGRIEVFYEHLETGELWNVDLVTCKLMRTRPMTSVRWADIKAKGMSADRQTRLEQEVEAELRSLENVRIAHCPDDGDVQASLVRGDHHVDGLRLMNALAFVCPDCGAVLAIPHQTAGRVALAKHLDQPAISRSIRVPVEVEDRALSVHAALGTLGAGERFSLPLHLGLRVAGRLEHPLEAWKIHDDAPKSVRARPRIGAAAWRRLERLQATWNAESISDVVRWLIVAASQASAAGLTTTAWVDS